MKSSALGDGFGRAIRSKRYVLLIFVVNLVIAAAMGYVVSESIESSLGNSASSDTMVESFDPLWYDGFRTEAQGIAETFDPRNSGLGGVFDAIDAFLEGKLFERPVVLLIAAGLYLLTWSFLSGGLLWHYQLMRRDGSFFASCRRYFPKFLLLGLLGGGGYYAVFMIGYPELRDWFTELTRESDDERWFFACAIARYIVLLVALTLVHLLVTYSKVITIVRNVPLWLTMLTPFRALWFFICHPLRIAGIYIALGLFFVLLTVAYGVFWHFYPDILPGGSTEGILLAFGAGQAYVLGRIFLRCYGLAAHMALFEEIRVLAPITPVADIEAEEEDLAGDEAALIAAAGIGGAVGGATTTYNPAEMSPSDELGQTASEPELVDETEGPQAPPYVADFESDDKIVGTVDSAEAETSDESDDNSQDNRSTRSND